MNKLEIEKAKTFDEHITIKYSKVGTMKRDSFEERRNTLSLVRSSKKQDMKSILLKRNLQIK
jgi:hypothetical protein